MKELANSLKEFAAALREWWAAVVLSWVLGGLAFWQTLVETGTIPAAFPSPPILPGWALWLLSYVAVLVGSLAAFHRVRVERDKLVLSTPKAHLYVEKVWAEHFEPDARPDFVVSVRNDGAAAATDAKLTIEINLGRDAKRDNRQAHDPQTIAIPPGQARPVRVQSGFILKESYLQEWRAGSLPLSVKAILEHGGMSQPFSFVYARGARPREGRVELIPEGDNPGIRLIIGAVRETF